MLPGRAVMPAGASRLHRLVVLTLAGILAGACGGPPDGGLTMSDARVRTVIPGQDRTAGYFSARNDGPLAIVLRGAHADGVRAIEMHETRRDGDLMRMRRLDSVEIAPGQTVRFQPGGRHLMLFGVTSLADEPVIVLELGDGTETAVTFATVPIGGE